MGNKHTPLKWVIKSLPGGIKHPAVQIGKKNKKLGWWFYHYDHALRDPPGWSLRSLELIRISAE